MSGFALHRVKNLVYGKLNCPLVIVRLYVGLYTGLMPAKITHSDFVDRVHGFSQDVSPF